MAVRAAFAAGRRSTAWRTPGERREPSPCPSRGTACSAASPTCSMRRPRLFLLLLLGPPLLWLGVVYVGSLIALLAQSFFSIDEFTGLIEPRARR